jgi:uncharacterized protein YerC
LRDLCQALRVAGLGSSQLLEQFLQDLCTTGELDDMANRWAAAIEVRSEGQLPRKQRRSQERIAQDLGISTNVVNHANKLVQGPDGTGGFVVVLDRLQQGREPNGE